MAEQVDYNYQPEVDGGKFLNLKSKGEKIVIRLADKPISSFRHWINGKPLICEDKKTCETCNKTYNVSDAEVALKEKRQQVFSWLVINRGDGEAYIFKGGIAIFRGISEYGKNPKWGDPINYDLEITRTEIKPQYYSIVPDPGSIGTKLTKDELDKVAKLEPLLDFTTTKDPKQVEEITEEDYAELEKTLNA